MRVLVTGAAGFIGFHTAQRLLDRGDEVIGLDNLSPYYDVSLKEARLARLKGRNGFGFIKGDLAEREIVEAVFAEEKPTRVIHLAAQAGVRYSLDHPHVYVEANMASSTSYMRPRAPFMAPTASSRSASATMSITR